MLKGQSHQIFNFWKGFNTQSKPANQSSCTFFVICVFEQKFKVVTIVIRGVLFYILLYIYYSIRKYSQSILGIFVLSIHQNHLQALENLVKTIPFSIDSMYNKPILVILRNKTVLQASIVKFVLLSATRIILFLSKLSHISYGNQESLLVYSTSMCR